jgi:putative aldouronate transport system permease protein
VNVDLSRMSAEEIELATQLNNKSLNAAKIFIAMIPVLLVYPFLQRYFITGITLGSVKE